MSADNPAKANIVASAPPAPGEADYDAICAAVLATERGRWFLAEYARRNRQADTVELVAAIERIAVRSSADAAALWGTPPDHIHVERLRAELADMADAIVRTRTELASAMAGGPTSDRAREASGEPDDDAAERFDVLAAAEEIQELAWAMREQGFDSQFSDRLDRCAAICLASSGRERGMGRVRKIRHVMRHLQGRIEAIIAMLGAAAPAVATKEEIGCEETQKHGVPSQRGTAQGTDGHATDALAPAVQIPPRAPAGGDEGDAQGAAKELGSVVIPSPEKEETGEFDDSPASTDDESATTDPPAIHVAGRPTTLTIEGPKGSFSIMPARAARRTGPLPRLALPFEGDSTTADVQAFALDLAAEADGPPAARSPAAQSPAMPVFAEANRTSPAAQPPSTGADDIFLEGEGDLPLVAAPRLGGPPQRAVEELSAGPSTDVAEYLLADVMALSEEERCALFT